MQGRVARQERDIERALFRELQRSPMRRPLAALGLHRVLYGSVLHLAAA